MILPWINYSKSPTYEQVPFWECICKSNLFISPTKPWYPTNTISYMVLHWLMWVDMWMHICIFFFICIFWKFETWRFICRALTVLLRWLEKLCIFYHSFYICKLALLRTFPSLLISWNTCIKRDCPPSVNSWPLNNMGLKHAGPLLCLFQC